MSASPTQISLSHFPGSVILPYQIYNPVQLGLLRGCLYVKPTLLCSQLATMLSEQARNLWRMEVEAVNFEPTVTDRGQPFVWQLKTLEVELIATMEEQLPSLVPLDEVLSFVPGKGRIQASYRLRSSRPGGGYVFIDSRASLGDLEYALYKHYTRPSETVFSVVFSEAAWPAKKVLDLGFSLTVTVQSRLTVLVEAKDLPSGLPIERMPIEMSPKQPESHEICYRLELDAQTLEVGHLYIDPRTTVSQLMTELQRKATTFWPQLVGQRYKKIGFSPEDCPARPLGSYQIVMVTIHYVSPLTSSLSAIPLRVEKYDDGAISLPFTLCQVGHSEPYLAGRLYLDPGISPDRLRELVAGQQVQLLNFSILSIDYELEPDQLTQPLGQLDCNFRTRLMGQPLKVADDSEELSFSPNPQPGYLPFRYQIVGLPNAGPNTLYLKPEATDRELISDLTGNLSRLDASLENYRIIRLSGLRSDATPPRLQLGTTLYLEVDRSRFSCVRLTTFAGAHQLPFGVYAPSGIYAPGCPREYISGHLWVNPQLTRDEVRDVIIAGRSNFFNFTIAGISWHAEGAEAVAEEAQSPEPGASLRAIPGSDRTPIGQLPSLRLRLYAEEEALQRELLPNSPRLSRNALSHLLPFTYQLLDGGQLLRFDTLYVDRHLSLESFRTLVQQDLKLLGRDLPKDWKVDSVLDQPVVISAASVVKVVSFCHIVGSILKIQLRRLKLAAPISDFGFLPLQPEPESSPVEYRLYLDGKMTQEGRCFKPAKMTDSKFITKLRRHIEAGQVVGGYRCKGIFGTYNSFTPPTLNIHLVSPSKTASAAPLEQAAASGVLPSTSEDKPQAITPAGRTKIQESARYLWEQYQHRIVYGESDSISNLGFLPLEPAAGTSPFAYRLHLDGIQIQAGLCFKPDALNNVEFNNKLGADFEASRLASCYHYGISQFVHRHKSPLIKLFLTTKLGPDPTLDFLPLRYTPCAAPVWYEVYLGSELWRSGLCFRPDDTSNDEWALQLGQKSKAGSLLNLVLGWVEGMLTAKFYLAEQVAATQTDPIRQMQALWIALLALKAKHQADVAEIRSRMLALLGDLD